MFKNCFLSLKSLKHGMINNVSANMSHMLPIVFVIVNMKHRGQDSVTLNLLLSYVLLTQCFI